MQRDELLRAAARLLSDPDAARSFVAGLDPSARRTVVGALAGAVKRRDLRELVEAVPTKRLTDLRELVLERQRAASRRGGRRRRRWNPSPAIFPSRYVQGAVDLDEAGQAPCPSCDEVLTNGGEECAECRGDRLAFDGGGQPGDLHPALPGTSELLRAAQSGVAIAGAMALFDRFVRPIVQRATAARPAPSEPPPCGRCGGTGKVAIDCEGSLGYARCEEC